MIRHLARRLRAQLFHLERPPLDRHDMADLKVAEREGMLGRFTSHSDHVSRSNLECRVQSLKL